MENKLHISVSPHIHRKRSTTGIMLDVIIALLPATIAGIVLSAINSGDVLVALNALAIIVTCVATSVVAEVLFNLVIKKKQTIGDLSCVVTGLLLALNLSVGTPLWQVALGAIFAVVIVKCLFGGLGKNLVNPAVTGRVFMLVAFASLADDAVDATAGATPLGLLAEGAEDKMPQLMDLLVGTTGGAIGETCRVALLLGGLYLLVRKVISWHIPVAFIGTVFVLSFLLKGFDAELALAYVLSGGLVLGAIFMATDYTTSPRTALGKLVFGIGAGVITVVIRFWGAYPEGVSFAILLMNIVNPLICSLGSRKLFGGAKK